MSKTVLFVADDPSLFETVAGFLADRGIQCVYANTPTTAVAALSLMSINAALVDLQFPGGAAGELSLQLSTLTDAAVRLISRDDASCGDSLWALLKPALRVKPRVSAKA